MNIRRRKNKPIFFAVCIAVDLCFHTNRQSKQKKNGPLSQQRMQASELYSPIAISQEHQKTNNRKSPQHCAASFLIAGGELRCISAIFSF